MKYFYDTEFLEGTQKKWFGNTKPTIDLISIGIVSEDNREYYAISKDFNLYEAWNRFEMKYDDPFPPIKNRQMGYSGYLAEEAIFRAIPKKVYWIRENVLKPIFKEFLNPVMDYKENNLRVFNYKNFKTLVNEYGKSNKQIADEIKLFTMQYSENKNEIWDKPTFYGYYSAYDHVALCWLFGKMIDLPKGFPMYTIDLKQMLDEKISQDNLEINGVKIPNYNLDNKIQTIKNITNYPKQTNEHNALADAKWNFELYKFLQTLN
jgi:hypothetical protein